MSSFETLMQTVDSGIVGGNPNIPIGFPRLNNHISIRKSIYYLLGGYTGSGKTSFIDDAFVINPIEWMIRNKHRTPFKLHIIYFSMERKKQFKLAKWTSRRLFLDHNICLPINRIMGWCPPDDRLTEQERNLLATYDSYISEVESYITMYEGAKDPNQIRKIVEEYAMAHGYMDKNDKGEDIYVEDDPNLITIVLYDHIGLQRECTRKKEAYTTPKRIIDLSSRDAQYFRDMYNFMIVKASQFNRDIANPMRIKNGDVEPQLEDFKESGRTQEDADCVLTLFDVMRYKIDDPSGYDLDRLRDELGRKKYRSMKIAKNSYGSDDIRMGLAFQPVVGHFKEMPKASAISDTQYNQILSDDYFRTAA